MILGIDASNIRGGGGVTHLVEILRVADPIQFNFHKVIIWGGSETLSKIEDHSWLEKVIEPLLNKSLLHRTYWQKFRLSKLAYSAGCNILFIPGGSYSGKFKPFVTMSQNLLPFEWKEICRYKISKETVRLILLRLIQSRTFLRADGTIFLTEFARKVVIEQYPINLNKTVIINHGINNKFFIKPTIQKEISNFSESNPLRILYTSFIGEYKHQWNVVRGISLLKQKGYPVELTLIGDIIEYNAFKKFQIALEESKISRLEVKHYQNISYSDIHTLYTQSHIFVFASSCETFGQILTEAMASGLPIACSKMSAMPEILEDAGIYFDPLNSIDIYNKLEKLILDHNLRNKLSNLAYENSKKFSWEKCSNSTFEFITNSL